MKKENKTIIIGAVTTVLALIISLFTMYKIMDNKKPEVSDKPVMTEYGVPESDQDYDLSTGTGINVTETVTVHIFKSSTCPHCKAAIAFFESILKDYDYLEVKTYEVKTKENVLLMQKVATEMGDGKVTGVPYIIIGDDFTLKGYSEKRNDILIETIQTEHENKNYHDVVEKLVEENADLDVSSETLKTN